MSSRAPRIALIGGLDPGGQAGLAADLSACFSCQAHGLPVAAARTAQSDGQWLGSWPTAPDELASTLQAVGAIHAIKTGMLGSIANLQAVQNWSRDARAPLVVDPLLWSTSGGWMWPGETERDVRRALRDGLLPFGALVTPNWTELAWLCDAAPAADPAAAIAQARSLTCAVLVKGGHAPEPWRGQDWLVTADQVFELPRKQPWTADRSGRTSPRGTGCRLATAAAIELARGQSVLVSAQRAVGWLDQLVRNRLSDPKNQGL